MVHWCSSCTNFSGDYTVRTMMGTMYRIDGRNADALGYEVKADALPVVTDGKPTDEHIWEMLGRCYDPEIPIVNIVELAVIYRMELKQEQGTSRMEVDMTLTAPGCGMAKCSCKMLSGRFSRSID